MKYRKAEIPENRYPVILCELALVLAMLFSPRLPAQPAERYAFEHPQMGTLFRITLYAGDEATARQAAEAAFSRVDSLNAIFSDYQADSEISRLSSSAVRQFVPVSKDLWRVLLHAQEMARHSDGAFDLSIGPLSRLWRRAFRRQTFPEWERIQAATAKVNYQFLVLDTMKQALLLQQPGMRLDAGGIAKGYAVDEAMSVLRRFGISMALVDGGGDLRAGDAPPGQEGWTIQIKTVDAKGKTVDSVLTLQRAALATSGDTYRYLEWEGQRYAHIIDPRSGLGITHGALVSVQCPCCITADALASAISVMGPEADWKSLLEKYPRCRAQLIIPKGNNRYRQRGGLKQKVKQP
jgi:thiamine biosynthesis lipoprotein